MLTVDPFYGRDDGPIGVTCYRHNGGDPYIANLWYWKCWCGVVNGEFAEFTRRSDARHAYYMHARNCEWAKNRTPQVYDYIDEICTCADFEVCDLLSGRTPLGGERLFENVRLF